MSGVRDICLGDSLDAAAALRPDMTGWIFGDERVTFSAMRDRANLVARGLMAMGVGKGDVVALWMSNRPEFAYCLMGCAKIGAIVAAVNTRSRSFELEHTLRHSGAKVLVRLDSFLKMDFRAILAEVVGAENITADGAVASTAFPGLKQVISITVPPLPGARPWQALLDAASKVSAEAQAAAQAALHWDEPVILQYTSGTTAQPKGALCSQRYISNFGVETVRRLGVKAGEAMLNTQPFYHNGGSCGALCVPLTTGHCSVMPEYYEAERVLQLIERERCVARSGFGAMYIMEMAHPNYRKYDISSLRAGWCIAPVDVMRRVQKEMHIPVVLQIYGATEGGGTAGDVDDPPEKQLDTCGRAVPGTEIAIADPDSGRHLAPGQTGEILVRGWYLMSGYYRQPEATAEVMDAEGWLHTGDYGALDEQGYLYFKGRLKNMLKVGGENVSAEEVEAMLLAHPKVKMAAAIGMPDPRLQEVVMAVVQTHEGMQATEEEIIAFCKERMANFRVPRAVRFVNEWPLTGSGKIQRHVLRQALVESPSPLGNNEKGGMP